MENRVFVWNSLPSPPAPSSAPSEDADATADDGQLSSDVPPQMNEASAPPAPQPTPNASSSGTVKKVFKCPECSFWASTASRFHVHIVGHLNKKPFECSLCNYRSNWRWDITKHIRLKSARDAGHERARVLMTDETGRRNYAKYNKYLTVLRVRDANAQQATSRETSVSSTTKLAGEAAPRLVLSTKSSKLNAASQSVTSTQSGGMTSAPPLRPLLPAPPRLTPAPVAAAAAATPGPPPLSPALLRPPPPLAPAVLPGPPRLQPAPKRPAPSLPAAAEQGPPAKKSSGETKRTLWKCKKCNYRDPQRELVLAHVKQHYQQRAQATATGTSTTTTIPVSLQDSEASVAARFKCGHCGQVSHWKHVIQRHCRLKHDGNVHIVTAPKCTDDSGATLGVDSQSHEKTPEEESEGNAAELRSQAHAPLQCTSCPFSCVGGDYMNQHQQNHQPHPGAIFKCYMCPYYVALKTELLDHLQLHGVSEPEEHLSRTLQQTKTVSCPSPSKVTSMDSEIGGSDCGINSLKRYRCAGCPYVSNSKSQFLYHKQFHRPRGAPFKCGLCSYSVSRRHLLHQHLRVHGILIPPRSPVRDPAEHDAAEQDGLAEGEEEAVASGALRAEIPDLDTRQLPEVPLVWVSRNGRFDKLFKCRWCPHVNQRKANIMEHEKMHRRDEVEEHSEGDEESSSLRPLPPHRCPLCNYGCHNAGVLSAHMKVHQGAYGTVRALVDNTRTDEAQLEELGAASDCLPPMLLPQTTEETSHAIEEGQEETLDFRLEPPPTSEPPPTLEDESVSEEVKMLYFCLQCPARFLVMKELGIHKRFHDLRFAHRCESCSYTARQRSHLLAHIKVHTDEYQERTEALASLYSVCPSYPRPRTAVIVEGPGVSGPVWVVVSGGLSTGPAAPPELEDAQGLQDPLPPPPRPMAKQFLCPQCPANFFKSVALEYHKTLHGGSGNYGCRYCNYRVKTYGNLVKHEMIHEGIGTEAATIVSSRSRSSSGIPLSGTDLFQQRVEAQKQTEAGGVRFSGDLPADPQFGTLMHGNPEFVYPMYFKNGRLKEKRYKCHKCPSAFEKREQYKVHLSLHGSKQRYKCEKCDYSVKYYANFIQHQRKHQHNDEAHAARRAAESNTATHLEEEEDASGVETPKPPVLTPRSTKSIGSASPRKLTLSAAEQQAVILQEVRGRVNVRCEEDRKALFRCAQCPYSSARRDGLESHAKRHASISGAVGAFACSYCDYSAPQLHFLREHIKLHFDATRKLRPEAYTHMENLQLWVEIEGEDRKMQLVFQDNGSSGNENERFCPALPGEVQSFFEVEDEESRIYVDHRTGEPLVGEQSNKGSNIGKGSESEAESGAGEEKEEKPRVVDNEPEDNPVTGTDSDEEVETTTAPQKVVKLKGRPGVGSKTRGKAKSLPVKNAEKEKTDMKADVNDYTKRSQEVILDTTKISTSRPDDGESLSASSSCDSSSSNSSSGSSSSSSSSSSGTSSSSTTNDDSKSSDSSSDSDSEESDRAANGTERANGASPTGSLSSDTEVV